MLMAKRRYKLTEEQYTWLMLVTNCQVCHRELGERGRAKRCIDHDHATGKIRGVLCIGCNTGLGSLNDSPDNLRRAAEYLEELS